MNILNAQTLSAALMATPGHTLREVCASLHPSPYSTVLTGAMMTNTGISGEDVGALVTVTIVNPQSSWGLRNRPSFPTPRVICHEQWIARDIDWHAYPDGELCWEIFHKWQDQLDQMHQLAPTAVAEFAALYFLNSTRWLIGRHRLKYLFNLPKWRDDWLQWDHGTDGLTQYLNERRRRE